MTMLDHLPSIPSLQLGPVASVGKNRGDVVLSGYFLSLHCTSGSSAPEEVSLCDGFLFQGSV